MKISYESRIIKMFGPPGFKHVKHEYASLALFGSKPLLSFFCTYFKKMLVSYWTLGQTRFKICTSIQDFYRSISIIPLIETC